jgi:RNA polymerase sigma-70 factor (sigma-E family)
MARMDDAAAATEVTAHETQTGFEAFFRAQHPRLLRALYVVTGDRQEAEDVTQEAFLSVWERWERVRRMEDPVGYLYRTAMNAHRSRRRRLLRAVRQAMLGPPSTDELGLAEARDAVARALATLTVRQRAALVLTEMLGYGSDEAAVILGVRPGTVRSLASQGRAALRALLEEDRDA